MIARSVLASFTLGLSLGALYMLYEHRAPIKKQPLEATGILRSFHYTPDEILYLHIRADCQIYLYQKEGAPTIALEADQAIADSIEVVIAQKAVTIREKMDTYADLHEIPVPTILIVLPDIAAISMHGKAQVIGKTALIIDSLDITMQGNSILQAEIHAKQLDIEAHGSSSLHLSGRVEEQQVRLAHMAKYMAPGLITQNCSIHTSDQSIAYINAQQQLNATLKNTSSVTFLGEPYVFLTKDDHAQLKKYKKNSIAHKKFE